MKTEKLPLLVIYSYALLQTGNVHTIITSTIFHKTLFFSTKIHHFCRRESGKQTFEKSWQSYVNGFGSAYESYWLGLEAIFELTNQQTPQTLRIELTDCDGLTEFVEYDSFKVW